MAGRAIGEFAIVEHLPDVVVVLFAALTQLADTWFVFGTLAAFYWLASDRWSRRPRRAGATLIALAVCGLAVTTFLKILVGAPRPPAAATPAEIPAWLPGALGAVYVDSATATGFGFPSGHVVGAVMIYGGLALLLDCWDRTRRLLAAGGLVSLVAVSRVVIQVHYVVDVVVGVVVGVAVVWGVLRAAGYPDRLDPRPGFVAAAVLSGGALALAIVNGYEPQTVKAGMGVGTALGGLTGWRLCTGDESCLSAPATVVTILVTGGLWLGTFAVKPPIPATILLTFVATGGILAAPTLATQWGSRSTESMTNVDG